MKIQERICRLCLEKCEHSKGIAENMKHVLPIVLPKMDLTVIQEPVMCTNCAEMLEKWFNFRATCLHTYNSIVLFGNNKDDIKLDLNDVYTSKNENVAGIPKDEDICGFCMGLVKNRSCVPLDVEDRDITLKEMIERCLPELNLSIIKKPVICTHCHGSLENCFRFVMNCLNVDERINKYCETLDINSKGQIELSSLLQFTAREGDGKLVNTINVKKELCEERESGDEEEIDNGYEVVKLEPMFCDDYEAANEIDDQKIKSFVDLDFPKFKNEKQFMPKNVLACKEENDKLEAIKMEQISCGEDETQPKEENLGMEYETVLIKEETELKSDKQEFNRFESGFVLPQLEGGLRLYRRKKCLTSNLEGDLSEPYIKRTPTNTNFTKITMYHCERCPFQTKCKRSMILHCQRHRNPLETPPPETGSCSFQAKYKNSLSKRNLFHQDCPLYQCQSCSYQTQNKADKKTHKLAHKDPLEVIMYNCDSCSFQTKNKYYLKNHLLTHKDPSEVTMYKCDSCTFETRNKHYLKIHKLSHMNPSALPVYKCDSCSFQAKRKDILKTHLLIHKDPSQITMHKCGICSFQTKRKYRLKNHLQLHKDPSEITWHRCDSCSFQTRRSSYLKIHLLLHKDPSEVTMYSCDSCPFQTKIKYCLKTHLLKHKDPSEVTIYTCDSCSYQTKHKDRLKTHSLVHKDPSEVTMYKCSSCSYETKRKHYLKRHEMTHKNSGK